MVANGNKSYEALAKHAKVEFLPITITTKGYVYIWVSNESEATKVWFDDLAVTHNLDIVTQATDYGPWGDVVREQKTNDLDVYRYAYQGQYAEKDDETGWEHFELREYDRVIGRWTIVDPKRQFRSPYIGMGNNPIRYGDKDGRDIIILNDVNGAGGFGGHGAILVGNGNKWYLYSKNGAEVHGFPWGAWGNSYDPDDGTPVGSLDNFFDNLNKDENGKTRYDRAFRIKTDSKTDELIKKAASKEVNDYYLVIGSSCADVWNCALDKSGHSFFSDNYWPNDDYIYMRTLMPIFYSIDFQKVRIPTIELGPLIQLREGETFNPDNYKD